MNTSNDDLATTTDYSGIAVFSSSMTQQLTDKHGTRLRSCGRAARGAGPGPGAVEESGPPPPGVKP